MKVEHVRLEREMKIQNALTFMANERIHMQHAYAGDIMTMPGLSTVPAAYGMDIDADGRITGLF